MAYGAVEYPTMKRKTFLQSVGLFTLSTSVMTLSGLKAATDALGPSEKMPLMFVGHGNPMHAISDNQFTRGWANAAKGLQPKAILCVSAHWETQGTHVTVNEKPKTIHDFYGFPKELFDVEYPAPGSPEYAKLVQEEVTSTEVGAKTDWGLDHGTWSILVKMFPKADVPVFQLSLDRSKPPSYHYNLARELKGLRKRGVLIIGSGNIVHNLRMANFRADKPYDWALEFDQLSKELIQKQEHQKLINYQGLGQAAQLSIPTPEHYLPMLYILAMQDSNEEVQFFNEEIDLASASMRSFVIG